MVALGGGAIERLGGAQGARPTTCRSGATVDERIAWERASGSGRPLAVDRDRVLRALTRAASRSTSRSPARSCPRTPREAAGPRRALAGGDAGHARGANGLGRIRERRLPGRGRRGCARAAGRCARGAARAISRRGPSASPTRGAAPPPSAARRGARRPSACRAPSPRRRSPRRSGSSRELASRRARTATTACWRSAAAWSATWPASARPPTSGASRWSRRRRRSSPRSTRPTAARPGSTFRREELRRRVPPADRGACRPRDARTLPPRSSLPGSSRCSRPALIAGDPLWERVGAIEDLDPAAMTDVIFELRADQDRRRRRGRAGLGAPHGPQPRPHGRPRDRGGDAATRATATARRSASACSRRCGSRARTGCASEVEGLSPRHGLPVSLDASVDVDGVLEALGARQEADRGGPRLRPALRARASRGGASWSSRIGSARRWRSSK